MTALFVVSGTNSEKNQKLIEHKFDELKTFKVEYKKSDSKTEIHTVLTAKKKSGTSYATI